MRIGPSLSLTQFRGSGGGITPRLDAPGNIDVEVAGTTYEVTFDAVVGASTYAWRLDGAGAFTNIGAATSFSSTAAAGSHTVQVRALDAGSVLGHIGTSGSFAIEEVAAPVFSVDPVATSDGDLANPVVGDTVSCSTGTVSGSPTFAYQWRHVSDDGDATGTDSDTADYPIDASDEGEALYCHVTATNAGGSAAADSNASGVVVAASGTAVDWLIDFTGTAGNLVTPTVMDNSTHGTAAGTWGYVVDPTLHTRLATTSVVRRTPLTTGGSDYSTATRMLKFDFDEAQSRGDAYEGLALAFTDGTRDDYTITALVQFNGAEGTAVNNDHFVLGGSGFAVAQHQIGFDTSTLCAHGQIEGGGSSLGLIIPTEPATWYSLTLRFNGGGNRASVCLIDNTTGALVKCSEAGLLGSDLTYFHLKDYLAIPDSGNMLVALLAGASSGAFPLEPVTIPQPTSVTATQTNSSELTVAWEGKVSRWHLERSSDAGSTWTDKTAVATGQFVFGFVDTTVVDGSTYIYRITGLMGDDLESSPLTTSPVTIDNSAFHGAWASALSSPSGGGAGSGERGVEILVGAADIVVTDIGCWFVAGTYGNVAMKIRTNSSTVVASGTVLVAGATVGAYNYVTLGSPYTMLAGQTYFITRDVSGFNEYANSGAQVVNSTLAARVRGVDETCTDPGLTTPYAGINFKF